ncbi:hypothetical protein [Caulobacter endophyticus]|uniref:hypothetical protein n=1 Tax=Caulobacter endophyticus TaxID=2172652 RepID=UPI00241095DD|nr:hypothetical protein [Caulobacter endophyticus]MDG2530791.1 hypothetical protein [Caulobacter endophyticus]
MSRRADWCLGAFGAALWIALNLHVVWWITGRFARFTSQEWFWIAGVLGGLHIGLAILILADRAKARRRARSERSASDVWTDA